MNSTDRKTLAVVAKTGFTFHGDAHFASYRSAVLCLGRMERAGLVERKGNEFVLTAAGREEVA